MKFLKSDKIKSDLFPLLLFAIVLFFLGLFLKVTQELFEDNKILLIDQQILVFISKWRTHWLTEIAINITALGSVAVIGLFSFLLFVFFLVRRDFISCLYLFGANAGAGIIVTLLKKIFLRPRPDVVPALVEKNGYSFPSGHTLSSTVFYLMMVVLSLHLTKDVKMRILLLCFACLIICLVSFSRLYLGVHYPSDIVSGITLGTSWVLTLSFFYWKRINTR